MVDGQQVHVNLYDTAGKIFHINFCKICLFQCKTLGHLENVLFFGSQLKYIIIMILDDKVMFNVNGKSLTALW